MRVQGEGERDVQRERQLSEATWGWVSERGSWATVDSLCMGSGEVEGET